MLGVAERVKQRRLEKGWTQNMLATKSGVSLASYRRFESSGEMFQSYGKEKSHIDFCRELKAQNAKITLLGTYKGYNSKIAVRCDKCGCEWSPSAASLLHGHGCPKCAGVKLKSHAEFVKDLKSQRDDVVVIGRYVKALEKLNSDS